MHARRDPRRGQGGSDPEADVLLDDRADGPGPRHPPGGGERARDSPPAPRLRALDAAALAPAQGPRARAEAPVGVGPGRQAPDPRRGQRPWHRGGGDRRDDAGGPGPRHDAVRRAPGHRSTARSRDRDRPPDDQPGRPGRRNAGERQRVRHEPRLPRAVPAGGPHQRGEPARVAGAGRAHDARVLQPDARRGRVQAAQPRLRVRSAREVEPAAARRERGGPRRRRHGHPAPRQRLEPGRGDRRGPVRPAVRGGLGRLGAVLLRGLHGVLRPRRLDRRDVRRRPRV